MAIKTANLTTFIRLCGHFLLVCVSVLFSAPLTALTLAQLEVDKVDLFQLSLVELMTVEVEVATKFKTQASLTPSSVTVFTRSQIQNMGFETLESLLNYVPGFDVSRDLFSGQGYTITPRGRSSNQNSRDVLVLINGQRINDDPTGGATQVNRNLALANVKQVEIIRGPGSSLYGSNAFLGVINVVTDNQLNETDISMNQHQDISANFHRSADLKGWQSSLFTRFSFSQGEQYTTQGSGIDALTSDPISGQQLYVTTEKHKLKMSMRYNHQHMDDFYLFGFLSNGVNDYDIKSHHGRVEYTFLNDDNEKLTTYMSVSRRSSEALIRVADNNTMEGLRSAGITTSNEAFLAGFISASQDIEVGANWTFNLSEKHNITSGFEIRNAELIKQKNKNNYELLDFINVLVLGQAGTIEYYGDVIETSDSAEISSRTITGLYVQDEYRWQDNILSTVGLRFDHYSDFGHSINPRAALLYEVSEGLQFKLMYGEAFRAPSPIELTVKNSPAELGNPDLDAEKIKTIEFSSRYSSVDHVMVLTLFENDISNSITQVALVNDPRVSYENSGTVSNQGVELEYSYQLNRQTQLISNYTHYERLNEQSLSTPSQLASLIVNYQSKNININVNGIYRGDRWQMLPASKNLGSFAIYNVFARMRMTAGMELGFGINNIIDKEVKTVAFSTAMSDGVPNRGREVFLKLKWSMP